MILTLDLRLRDQEEPKSITVDLFSPDPKDYIMALVKCGPHALERLKSEQWDRRGANALTWVQVNKVLMAEGGVEDQIPFEVFEQMIDWSEFGLEPDPELDEIEEDLAALSSYQKVDHPEAPAEEDD